MLRDNPLGHMAARKLMRAMQRMPVGATLKQVRRNGSTARGQSKTFLQAACLSYKFLSR